MGITAKLRREMMLKNIWQKQDNGSGAKSSFQAGSASPHRQSLMRRAILKLRHLLVRVGLPVLALDGQLVGFLLGQQPPSRRQLLLQLLHSGGVPLHTQITGRLERGDAGGEGRRAGFRCTVHNKQAENKRLTTRLLIYSLVLCAGNGLCVCTLHGGGCYANEMIITDVMMYIISDECGLTGPSVC